MANDPYAAAPVLPESDAIDPRQVLGSEGRPVEIEIGSGRGQFIVERVEANAEVFMLGLEVRRKWAFIVDARLREKGLGARGRVFSDDARSVLRKMTAGSVARVFVHFPDPWWKKRHQKRRVVTPELFHDVARVLVPDGQFFLQTDVLHRAEEFEQMALTEPRLVPLGETVGDTRSARVRENPYGAMSLRERHATRDGLPIARILYGRTA